MSSFKFYLCLGVHIRESCINRKMKKLLTLTKISLTESIIFFIKKPYSRHVIFLLNYIFSVYMNHQKSCHFFSSKQLLLLDYPRPKKKCGFPCSKTIISKHHHYTALKSITQKNPGKGFGPRFLSFTTNFTIL